MLAGGNLATLTTTNVVLPPPTVVWIFRVRNALYSTLLASKPIFDVYNVHYTLLCGRSLIDIAFEKKQADNEQNSKPFRSSSYRPR
jgi:hypothetical protein